MAYPGEDVHFVPPAGPSFGGIHGLYGPNPGVSKWIVISGLRIEGGGDAAAIAATIQAVTKLRGTVTFVAAGTLPNDGKVIEDSRPVA